MTDATRTRFLGGCYAVTIFLSAFLLFQVQPIMGKCVLPWFGGTPAVWTTCMLFFQIVLFAGYAYAHVSSRYLTPRNQVVVHVLLLALAAISLPILPDASWKPTGGDTPVTHILLLLAASVGLPYLLLSSTGPLVQGWFSRTNPGQSPYRLYSLSNIGSLLALGSYPFLIEPTSSTATQSWGWSIGFGLFAVLCTGSAILMWRTAGNTIQTIEHEAAAPIPKATFALWFCLAMAPSVMLLATTNQVCMDVAVIPFLWIVPLTLYLLSFILCFDSDHWYRRRIFILAMLASLACVSLIMLKGVTGTIVGQILVYFAALFFACMVCHGELVRLKPAPAHLTAFYLIISAGGACGGLFVALIAPVMFSGYYELPLAMGALVVLTLIVYFRDPASGGLPALRRYAVGTAVVGFYPAFTLVLQPGTPTTETTIAATRNFYGTLRVETEFTDQPEKATCKMLHGRVVHGWQFLDPSKRHWPTTYYGEPTGVGQAMRKHRADQPRHVGMVGLGIGTLATYAQPCDRIRFYEINPDVVTLAKSHFHFLGDCQGQLEIVPGDARLSLEYEADQNFDVLVLDAFSGDAIPVHLLTKEALAIYARHLKPDGVLAVHISNLYFNLEPVVSGLAEGLGGSYALVHNKTDEATGVARSYWCLVSRQPESLTAILGEDSNHRTTTKTIVWTDDRNNLLEVLK